MPVPEAVALLSDITRQGELHPQIIEVKELPTQPGALHSYAIKDRLELGPVRFTITYLADTLTITDEEIFTVARQKPRTTIRNHVRLHDAGDGTVKIDVEITLEAPTLLHSFAFREGRAAHVLLAERMKTALESG